MNKYQRRVRLGLSLPGLVLCIIALTDLSFLDNVPNFAILTLFFIGVANGVILLTWLDWPEPPTKSTATNTIKDKS